MARLFSVRPSIRMRGRRFYGVRGFAGKPFHPPLTDFPIAGYVFAAVFDTISFVAYRRGSTSVAREAFGAATYAMIAGQLVGYLASITGFWDWWKGIPRERTGLLGRAQHTQVWRTINFHAVVMIATTLLAATTILVRLSQYSDHRTSLTVLVLSWIVAGLISLGSFYGGSLVFDYQFNVEDLKGSTAWDETEIDQLPGAKQQPPPVVEGPAG